MKFIKTILLGLFTLSFVTTQTLAVSPFAVSPENTAIVVDLDDVVIELDFNMSLGVFLYALPKNPLKWPSYINAMWRIKKRYTKINGNKIMEDDNGNQINGASFQFLYHGMKDKNLLPYVTTLIKFINEHRRFKPGTKEILEYLKTKGYEIDFATNKDRISYDDIAKKLGEKFTNLPTNVIVAHPGNNEDVMNQFKAFTQHPDLPDDYNALLQLAINAKPSGNIHHAKVPKPRSEYFDVVRKVVDENKNIIFIDDKEENTTAATRPKDNMIGIHFKNPIQFADELVTRGVLSEEKDKDFLEDLRKPKQNTIQQGLDYIRSFYSSKKTTA